METQVKFAVVGHKSRLNKAKKISDLLSAEMFIDENNNGSNWNHLRAIKWAESKTERVVIIEDDALLCDDFVDQCHYWIKRFPENIISFYLGTGRPPQYQLEIATKLIKSDKERSDFIKIKRLIHAVCYSLPKNKLNRVLECWKTNKPADFAIGDSLNEDVIYPVYSLVDHEDGVSVEKHPDTQKRVERRKAWRMYG